MTGQPNLANDAWEALLTAHAVVMKQFAAEDIWTDVSMREYDVLYTLSKCPGPVRLTELNRHVLLSQPALSRLVDHAGLPLKTVLDQLDLLGGEVVPVLRKEIAARQDPQTPDAPTHASLVRAKYGDEAPRQPRPNANRGDNVTGASPYQDSADEYQAEYPDL